ncbi:hypothetical protein ACN3XK_72580 [Actinomadura welshii]
MVHRVAAMVKAALAPAGMDVVHSTGEAAWQGSCVFMSMWSRAGMAMICG